MAAFRLQALVFGDFRRERFGFLCDRHASQGRGAVPFDRELHGGEPRADRFRIGVGAKYLFGLHTRAGRLFEGRPGGFHTDFGRDEVFTRRTCFFCFALKRFRQLGDFRVRSKERFENGLKFGFRTLRGFACAAGG